jgi:hypothetical protein
MCVEFLIAILKVPLVRTVSLFIVDVNNLSALISFHSFCKLTFINFDVLSKEPAFDFIDILC